MEFTTIILFAHVSDVKGSSDRRHEHSDERNAKNAFVYCTASKRTLLQWRIMTDDHPAVTFCDFFCERYLLAE